MPVSKPSSVEPTIPDPPPFVGDGTTQTQDSAMARVVMRSTAYGSEGTEADVTERWDELLAEVERLREALRDGIESCDFYISSAEKFGSSASGYWAVRNRLATAVDDKTAR